MRQFLAPALPDSGGNLTITGKDFRYLYHVLRLRPGDALHVRLPSGGLQTMAVTAVSGRSLCLSSCQGAAAQETGVTALQLEQAHAEPGVSLWLLQFMPKAQKLDVILRQAVEIGVAKVIPVVGAHCQKDAAPHRAERWERIIREARQQSGSPVETRIEAPCSLAQAMELWNAAKGESPVGVVLYERSHDTQGFHAAIAQASVAAGGHVSGPASAPAGVLIGGHAGGPADSNATVLAGGPIGDEDTAQAAVQPRGFRDFSLAALVSGCEGGFAPEEIATLKGSGFAPVHLDTNILRAETAAVYGLAVLQNLLTERPQWLLNESTC